MYENNRWEKITIRCTPEEKKKIKEKASNYNLTLSDYCRERCLGESRNMFRKKSQIYLRSAVAMQKSLNGICRAVEECPVEDVFLREVTIYADEIRKGVSEIWQHCIK